MQRYPSLNGLRAISICMVIAYHLYIRTGMFTGLSKIIWFQPFFRLITDGQLGVNVFFVISGFLITSLLLNEEERTEKISVKKFYTRRVLRIFPAYFFLLFVYGVLQIFKVIYIPRMAWLTAITYTKYFNWNIDVYTGHAWSLSIEEHFYLLWPLIFMTNSKARKYLIIFLILAVPPLRIFLGTDKWFYDLTIFTRIDAIATGCLFALYRQQILEAIKPYFKTVFITSLITLTLLTYFTVEMNTGHEGILFTALGTSYGTIANFSIAFILMYSLWEHEGLWFKMLNSSVANYIGLLSYSIYLWQQIFLREPSNITTRFPIDLICIAACSLFSYYIIEKPFLKLKTRFH